MLTIRCPQCGAQLHGDTTCAERLYRMLTSGGMPQAHASDAFARFALSHPKTHSREALELASTLLAEQRASDGHLAIDAASEDDESMLARSAKRRWWRRASRCH